MAYQVEFRQEGLDDLRRLDRAVAPANPQQVEVVDASFDHIIPQPLTGELQGLFKLRVGDYRIIYSVNSEQSLIVVHLVGHRREIYR